MRSRFFVSFLLRRREAAMLALHFQRRSYGEARSMNTESPMAVNSQIQLKPTRICK